MNCYFCHSTILKISQGTDTFVCDQPIHNSSSIMHVYCGSGFESKYPDCVFWNLTLPNKRHFQLYFDFMEDGRKTFNIFSGLNFTGPTLRRAKSVLYLPFHPPITPENSAEKIKIYLPFL